MRNPEVWELPPSPSPAGATLIPSFDDNHTLWTHAERAERRILTMQHADWRRFQRCVGGVVLLLPVIPSAAAWSQPTEPPAIPYTMCVENFFQKDDLLRTPDRMLRRLQNSGVSTDAAQRLASLKLKWDHRRDAMKVEFSSRWDPQIADGTVDHDTFLDEANRHRRELFLGFAEDFDQYLRDLHLNEATAVKLLIRHDCASLVVGGSAEGGALAERRLEEDFFGIIGGDVQ
jgi:hypothetical protein